jgi:hypothetical protein
MQCSKRQLYPTTLSAFGAATSFGGPTILGSRIVKVDPRPGLALGRNVGAHHLTEAFADREAKTRATVFPRCCCISLRELLK